MTDWRSQRDAALMDLDGEQRTEQVRLQAAVALYDLAAEDDARWSEMAAVLPRLLASKVSGVRRTGVALAALILDKSESEGLIAARLSDEAEEVRMEAAGQLADLATPTIRASLAAALNDTSFAVRFEAARGMAAVQHSARLEVLVEALEHAHLRYRALGALADLGDARALPALQKLFGRWFLPYFERTQAAGALVKLGDASAAAHLLSRTKRRWGFSADRPLAIELCGEVKVPGAFERLTELLRDKGDSEACRGAAARGLGRLGDARAVPPLVEVLEDAASSDDLKLDAAEGLCRLKLPEARAHVERVLPAIGSKETRDEMAGMLEERS
ncbi:MAG TPA: HEAT repeat domain-containing protein [Myxococcaceae bacterium]|nr:HEAT repeat domain-containing protein [Myxococcaceae bacterium]